MEFTIKQNVLKEELGYIQGVVERKSTIPVLSNILIESLGEGSIRIVGTDLDVTIRCDAEADIKQWRDAGFDDDPADTGSANFERERAQSLANHARRILVQIDDALARMDAGTYGSCERCGEPIEFGEGRYFYKPTVITDMKQTDEIIQDEVFGPVVSVLRFSYLDAVIERVNASRVGLPCGVFSRSLEVALRCVTGRPCPFRCLPGVGEGVSHRAVNLRHAAD